MLRPFKRGESEQHVPVEREGKSHQQVSGSLNEDKRSSSFYHHSSPPMRQAGPETQAGGQAQASVSSSGGTSIMNGEPCLEERSCDPGDVQMGGEEEGEMRWRLCSGDSDNSSGGKRKRKGPMRSYMG